MFRAGLTTLSSSIIRKSLPLASLASLVPCNKLTMEDFHHPRRRQHLPPPPPPHHHHHPHPPPPHQFSRHSHSEPYFHPPRGPPFPPAPIHEFPPGAGPHPGGPPPPPHVASWPSLPFSGPPLPHPAHMNFALPDERWNMRPPFIGGPREHFPGPPGGGGGGGGTYLSGATEAGLNFHSHAELPNNQLYHTNGPEGFPFQNGIGSSLNGVMEPSHGESQSKRKKADSRSVSKCHSPLRPMVDVNEELKLKHSTHISVISYNLLAQDLIEKNLHLYNHRSPEHLKWDYRKENLLSDLTQSAADILCLQEVQEDHYRTWYQPQLAKHGYSGVYKQRTGTNSDGCAIFYRDSKLNLLEWKGLEYQRRTKVLNRDNVATLAKFSVIKKGVDSAKAVFCIANTHLLFNPKAGEVKLAQMGYLMAELHKLAAKPGTKGSKDTLAPVLLVGDFNSIPNSPLLDFITSASLNFSNLSALMIAGYFEDEKKSRIIPIPLFPVEMNIGPNCTYKQNEPGSNPDGRTSNCDSRGNSSRVESNRDESKGRSLLKNDCDALQSSTHTEFTSTDMGGIPSRPMRTTRSARGAKVGGRVPHSGSVSTAESRSILESSSSIKRGSDFLTMDDLKSARSPTSGDSSIDELLSESVVSRSSSNLRTSSATENSKTESLSISSLNKKSSSRISKIREKSPSVEKGTKNDANSKQDGILTHTFTLVSAYPHSKSWRPSTVTTFHQQAFETVDYIFFSPVVCRMHGSRKQVTGFNLLKRKVLPSTHTLLDLGPQPHQYLSSDHLLLQATFQFSW